MGFRNFFHVCWATLLLSVFSSQTTFASDKEIWRSHVDSIGTIEFANSQVKDEVMAEFKKWGPDEASSLWKPFTHFRDIYRHNPDALNVVRALGVNFAADFYAGRFYGDDSLDDATHVWRLIEMFKLSATNLHDIPYADWRGAFSQACEGDFSGAGKTLGKTFQPRKMACDLSAFICHGANIYGDMLLADYDNKIKDECYFGAEAQAFYGFGIKLFASSAGLATLMLAKSDDYFEVALRSIKLLYEKRDDKEHLAFVKEIEAQLLKDAKKSQ